MQVVLSKNMVESLFVPTFHIGYSVITNALDVLYEKVKSKGVTMTILLAKAAAMALAHPLVVNATCKDGKNFTYNSSINIAVAVAIDSGLITHVFQDANKLDICLLSQKWKELVSKARSKQLQPNEYNSGTFTLSNLGMFGVDRFDAILPPGQGAIMAVGSSKPTVLARADGFFTVKNKMLVEHMIREEKTTSAYELIEIYSELIVARLPIIEPHKTWPIDLKEAISMIFASPRCSDIPELMDARKHFVEKYGKEFVTSTLEHRLDCGVNCMIVEKLSAKAPDIETKIRILTPIAKEHNVKWDSKAFEKELPKPKEDMLSNLPKEMEEYQRLRCRVVFHALQFRPEILALGNVMIERLRALGRPYIAYHPGLARDVLAFYGCAEPFHVCI